MKILVVLPAAKGVYPFEAEQKRTERIKSYAGDGIEIDVGFPASASGFNPYGGNAPTGVDLARNHVLVAERMIQAEQEGYDACVPFGMLDFGVEIAKTVCKIPIVGQTQATYAIASAMAHRWGVIGYRFSGHNHFWHQAKEYGYLDRIVGMGAPDMPNSEMPKRRDELFERFVSEGKRLVKDGAEIIICHGMSMSPIEFSAQEYADGIGVPVLEGMGCAVAFAQAWVRLGIPYSPVRYGSR